MKIFCIGRNYADHAKELGNAVPTEPLVFMKPPTALVREGKPFYLPDFTQDCHHEGEIVLRIGKNGRSVPRELAAGFIESIGFGLDFTARDLQDKLKAKGQPWELAKGFDGSAPVGDLFLPAQSLDWRAIVFELRKNGQTVQRGSTADLIFDFEALVVYISRFFTLQTGDLIFTGTPAGVGVAIGDVLEGFINGQKALHCAVKWRAAA